MDSISNIPSLSSIDSLTSSASTDETHSSAATIENGDGITSRVSGVKKVPHKKEPSFIEKAALVGGVANCFASQAASELSNGLTQMLGGGRTSITVDNSREANSLENKATLSPSVNRAIKHCGEKRVDCYAMALWGRSNKEKNFLENAAKYYERAITSYQKDDVKKAGVFTEIAELLVDASSYEELKHLLKLDNPDDVQKNRFCDDVVEYSYQAAVLAKKQTSRQSYRNFKNALPLAKKAIEYHDEKIKTAQQGKAEAARSFSKAAEYASLSAKTLVSGQKSISDLYQEASHAAEEVAVRQKGRFSSESIARCQRELLDAENKLKEALES